jgi:methyl-galactoside transport system permease protein
LEAARAGSTTTSTGFNYELDQFQPALLVEYHSRWNSNNSRSIIGTVLLQVINYGLNFIGENA